ncbi:AI-2E family transporter [Acidicapsa dinghuensis]|uniref:AI-2E family transporter n=1 Tax=Acidicapsa dinghuensis TaxID=2218256 RepID=A0ABW1EC84_9BACT|nr:AI-2E family transporter [Acidicapsa dinghuensis]
MTQQDQTIRSRSRWQMWAFFLLTLTAIVLCAFIVQPFLAGIAFAVTIAVCTQHPYRWLAARIRNRTLCASVALMVLLFVGIVPMVIIGLKLISQAASLITALQNGAAGDWILTFAGRHPVFADRLQELINLVDVNTTTHSAAVWSASHFFGFIGSSTSLVVQVVVMLFLLFFLWRDQQIAIRVLRMLLPMNESEADTVLHRLHDTIFATGFGRLVLAATQGILGGLAYWLLGVPGAVFWGFLTALTGLIPGFGALLIWGPIALYLGLSDHWIKAAILVIWGGGCVSLIDNILYPLVVGSRLRSHTAIIFLSILGGVSLFGVSGIILGPLIFSLADSLIAVWRSQLTAPSAPLPADQA